ncbi:hypothetical protein PPL_11195 [Heterostelium album PN500]|uniref:Uncharacterized protein n=1 Tax=Heterostelium pallidum (strain ATCC 26659 / Pp 5 / PN500) TaxID=670386 RepID=D3BTT5_HETP5|nr:hypothetical protein PPL_11195 [Heterostelium album PN500]EFA75121.1 hypothetical protein PPL_11195 [Heterostelium album PN500]|eukprot:XP_020427255.1 hypothetical protein PPL_11195 [Heterostelium album PN500]
MITNFTHAKAQLIYNRSNHVTLRSYQTQFQRISDSNRSCNLLICNAHYNLNKNYIKYCDYIIDISQMNKADNLSEKIPLNVKSVSIIDWKDNCIFNISDSSIRELDIKYRSNLKILAGSLPNTLENISIFTTFNANVLPSSIKTMIVDSADQEFIPGLFPQSLESLELVMYDKPLGEYSLPPNLKSLHLASSDRPSRIDVGHLPRSLETLKVDYDLVRRIRNLRMLSQFQSLTTIDGCSFEWIFLLPQSVTSLKIYNIILNNNYIEPGVIPSTITSLDFGETADFKLKPSSIPSSVRNLTIIGYRHRMEADVIPIGVKQLEMTLELDDFSVECIPNTVETLRIYSYNIQSKSLDFHSLSSIKKLSFFGDIKISIFPPNLESLRLIDNGELIYSSLPPTLKKLKLNRSNLVNDTLDDNSRHHQPKRLIMKVMHSYFKKNTLEDIPISVEIIKIDQNVELRSLTSKKLYNNRDRYLDYDRSRNFRLTSKKLYNNRDRYLVFNDLTYAQVQLIYNRSNHVTLRSYTKQFQQISDIQSCNLLICDHKANLNKKYIKLYDYIIDNSSICELELSTENNTKILSGSLPNTLETLCINNTFNANVLPNSVRTMTVDCEDQEFTTGLFPQSLESLELVLHENPLVEHCLPPNLKSLYLDSSYHETIIDLRHLPRSLETLEFDDNFDAQIENLSILSQFQRLTTIKGCHLEWLDSLPPSVTSLKFARIEIFSFDNLDNNYIEPGVIPSTITNLDFGEMGSYKLKPGSIPSSVINLSIPDYRHRLEAGVIPIGVKQLDITLEVGGLSVECIPNTMEKLTISSFRLQSKSLDFHELPLIKKLSIYGSIKIRRFPPSLESLTLIESNQILYSSLPPTLKKLRLESTNLVKGTLNDNSSHLHQPKRLILKVLHSYFYSFEFNKLEDIPVSVEIIRIDENVELRNSTENNLKILGSLPNTLEKITI